MVTTWTLAPTSTTRLSCNAVAFTAAFPYKSQLSQTCTSPVLVCNFPSRSDSVWGPFVSCPQVSKSVLVVDLQEIREIMLSAGDGDVRIPDERTHSLP